MFKANLKAPRLAVGQANDSHAVQAGNQPFSWPVAGFCALFLLIQTAIAIPVSELISNNPYLANIIGFCVTLLLAYLWQGSRFGNTQSAIFANENGLSVALLAMFFVSNAIIFLIVGIAELPLWIALVATLLIFPVVSLVTAGQIDRNLPAIRINSGTVCIAAATLIFALVLSQYLINQDTSWNIYAARQWLNGAVLYRDIMELNPPLVFYVMIPAVKLAQITGLGDGPALVLYLSSLIFISLLWIHRLVMQQDRLTDGQKTGLLIAAGLALLAEPINLVGQREHFAVVLSLPYLLALTIFSKDQGPSRLEWILLALFAWPGLALKPYFFLIPLMLSMVAAWQDRRWATLFSAANWTFAALCMAYVALIYVIHTPYLDTIIPIVTEVYFAFGRSTLAVIIGGKAVEFILFLLFLCALSFNRRDNIVLLRFVVWCIAGMLIYLLQFKGWVSHLLPFTSAIILTVGWVATSANLKSISRIILGVLALALVAPHLIQGVYRPEREPGLLRYLPGAASETSFVIWTSVMWMSFPLANESGAIWASRYPSQWLVPGAVVKLASPQCLGGEGDRCPSARAVLEFARRTAVDDLIKFKPETVFVDNQSRKQSFGNIDFDYIDFFDGDPRFKAEWANYSKEEELAKVDVWRRRHPATH